MASAPPRFSAVCAGVIDQDPPHHPRGDPEKVGAILPVRRRLIHEPKIHLMHQRRRLESVIRPFISEITGSESAQFLIGAGHQGGQGGRLPLVIGQLQVREKRGIIRPHKRGCYAVFSTKVENSIPENR